MFFVLSVYRYGSLIARKSPTLCGPGIRMVHCFLSLPFTASFRSERRCVAYFFSGASFLAFAG